MSELPSFNPNLDLGLNQPHMPVAVELQPPETLPGSIATTANPLQERLHNERGAISLDFLHNGIDRAGLALIGLQKAVAKRRLNRAQNTNELAASSEIYQGAAEASLAQKEPQAPYDPLRGFTKAHRARRAGYGEPATAPRDTSQDAVTILQQQAALRANLRVDALNASEEVQHKFTSLYGDTLHDKGAVKREHKSGNYTHGQKKSMKAAGKQVRRAAASEARIRNNLERSAAGQDVPGRVIQGRLNRKQRRARELTQRLQELD
jgi:hypothetical protein